MSDTQQPHVHKDNGIRPEERAYAVGWLLWCAGGVYLLYRGIGESRTFLLAVGVVAMLMGLTQSAVIVIKPLRPWKKWVRVTWVVIILLGLIIVQATDLLGR
ncbi:MAG TPA: hypothetical protein VE988_20365 [Gemmataceae bacterium]|nr:hypothetical protein [Gemmataceae bacterium]